MGLDINYQVIPDNCVLLARSRQVDEFCRHLEFFPQNALLSQSELEDSAEFCDEAEYRFLVEFAQEARQLIRDYPGIEERNLCHRKWDMLYYLLSPQRRNGGDKLAGEDWAEKAIFGDEVLSLGGEKIGHPIHYLSPIEVYAIQDKLDRVDADMLGTHWNPVAMRRAGVYKINGNESDESFQYLLELFCQFKAFYASVSEDEGVLVWLS
ncbi:DUF1877 family protein [Chamaesiphon sp. VAR_48_metabat_403]|uniref:DUF1877 family protein n=1 Tax=Chamaesiphon sp. VAR_48_metabat_403 TaxID=2964700 RepID=UPI00286DA51B|nr:DUF1877 family protein [Chamaesiphon sp. VAR_48_metabat_403]